MSDKHMISNDQAFDSAVDALRDVETPDPARAAATRQAILDALANERPSNVRPLRRGSPFVRALLLAAALGGTAFAANNTVRWVAARRVEREAELRRSEQAARVAVANRSRSANARRARELPAVAQQPALVAQNTATPATSTGPALAAQSPTPASQRLVATAAIRPRVSPATNRVTEAPANNAIEPAQGAQPVSPAEALYRDAHHAHFVDRSPAVALARWNQYLTAAPDGQFAPEAQFNRIVCLVRLGRTQDALAAIDALPSSHYRHDDAVRLRARLADGGSP